MSSGGGLIRNESGEKDPVDVKRIRRGSLPARDPEEEIGRQERARAEARRGRAATVLARRDCVPLDKAARGGRGGAGGRRGGTKLTVDVCPSARRAEEEGLLPVFTVRSVRSSVWLSVSVTPCDALFIIHSIIRCCA